MTVQVWDATSGQGEDIYRGHMDFWQQFFTAQIPGAPMQAARSLLAPPGPHLSAVAPRLPFVHPQDGGGPVPGIYTLAWSPDGHSIASGGLDEDMSATVQVWQPK